MPTSINHCHIGIVMAIIAMAALSAPAPVVGVAGPSSRQEVETQGLLRIPTHTCRSPKGLSAEMQTLLQIPVIIPNRPQLNCERNGSEV